MSVTQESAWIAAIAQGDRNAFEALYGVYSKRVFRYVFRMLRDEALAEEATNDVMVEIWKSAKKFEGRSKPSTWILGIARYKALNELRKRKPDAADVTEVEPADPSLGPEAEAGSSRLRERLKVALATLSPEHREVVELTFYQGCSYPEIAEITGVPVGTVKTRMFHAKKYLQPHLEREFREQGFAGETA